MNQPDVRPAPPDKYRLTQDFALVIFSILIRVPAGFLYDGASVPAWAWQITYPPYHPLVMLGALIHDWLYTNHQVSREDADRIFLELLLLSGADPAKADLMFKAVRVAGGLFWPNGPGEWRVITALKNICTDREFFEHYHFPVMAG